MCSCVLCVQMNRGRSRHATQGSGRERTRPPPLQLPPPPVHAPVPPHVQGDLVIGMMRDMIVLMQQQQQVMFQQQQQQT